MRDNLYGVKIPDSIIERLDQAANPLNEGKRICEELIEKLMQMPGISGVHLMGPNCENQCAELIKTFR
jgi:methylenetetrahydrofolate reductase (NADPH)